MLLVVVFVLTSNVGIFVSFSFLANGEPVLHPIPQGLNNVLVYVYDGTAVVNGLTVQPKHIARFEPESSGESGGNSSTSTVEADSSEPAFLSLQAAPGAEVVEEDVGHGVGHAVKLMVFAGKKLHQPIAWRG